MELTLTQEQRRYLNKKGLFTAKELQSTYTQSVKDQQKTLKQAEQIRNKQK